MSIGPWIVIAGLVLANALYVAAEFAAVAAERGRLAQRAEDGDRRARRLLALLGDGVLVDRYIAACQIGITLSSLIVGAYGQAAITPQLAPLLATGFDLAPAAAYSTAALAVLLGLTALQVVLGELVPKSLALQMPERMALWTFAPTRWSARVFRGFIWLLNGSGFLLLRPFGVKPGGHQHVHSPQEIQILISESRRGGALPPEMSRRLERGITLASRTVRDLMVPRDEIYGVEVSASRDELLERVVASPYSRVVVYRGSLDHVLGVIGAKDLIDIYAGDRVEPPLAELVRPLPSVREDLRPDDLVRLLQDRRSSKAIVVDDAGAVRGFVSVDDVLGEMFGEIGDERSMEGTAT